ncbi:MAG: hypothetical protein EBS19_06060, partial [Spirochaetia bacterium]|nr:hypothetical protein [Spirochaetia bacterium]
QSINLTGKGYLYKKLEETERIGVVLMDPSGDVQKKINNSPDLLPVTDTEKIYPHQTLISVNNSSYFLFFPSETTVRVFPNSEIEIRRMAYNKEGNIDELYLKRGVLSIKSAKRKSNDHFTIITPSLIIGVRGLEARVEVSPIKKITRVISFEGNTFVTQHKDEIPLSSEPVCNLSKDEMALEEDFRGNIDKVPFDFTEYSIENQIKFNYSELDLLAIYNRTEIEKITMKDGIQFRGVMTGMNEDYLFVHTLDSQRKIPKNQVKYIDGDKIR